MFLENQGDFHLFENTSIQLSKKTKILLMLNNMTPSIIMLVFLSLANQPFIALILYNWISCVGVPILLLRGQIDFSSKLRERLPLNKAISYLFFGLAMGTIVYFIGYFVRKWDPELFESIRLPLKNS
jgi:hypothetical protein